MITNTNLKSSIIILFKVVFLIAVFWFVFNKIDAVAFESYFLNASLPWLIISYLMLHISLWFSALRSRYYFTTYNAYFSKSFSIVLYYIGTAFNVILPGGIGGDGYRVYLLWKLEKFSKLTSLRIILYERVNGVYLLILLALLLAPLSSIILFIPYGTYLNLGLLILVTPCYFIGTKYIFKDKVPTMFYASFYSFWVQLFQLLFAFCLTRAILPDPNFTDYINFAVLFSIASIVAIIPISIGGAGLRELTFLYGASILNTSAESGIAFALMSFVLYVLTAVWGVPLFFYVKKIRRKDATIRNAKNR